MLAGSTALTECLTLTSSFLPALNWYDPLVQVLWPREQKKISEPVTDGSIDLGDFKLIQYLYIKLKWQTFVQ